jgi:arylsulfatase A-like enzyme
MPLCVDPWRTKAMRTRPGNHVTAGKHSSELFAKAAVDFLENADPDRPFFTYISFMAPHDPRVMPEAFRKLYDPADMPLPPNFTGGHPFDNGALRVRDELLAGFPRDPDEIREHLADYLAMITLLDAQIGQVLDTLERSGRAANTIVVFAGDNGLALGQHGLMGKQSLYEHSVRVPLIFAGPGIPQGARREALVYLLDIFPTLCDLIGIPLPDSVEGRSLVPAMRDQDLAVRDTLYLAYTGCQRAVRTRRHKLIETNASGRRYTQLFDLRLDPWEQHNLAQDPSLQGTLHQLRAELMRLREAWDDQNTPWGQEFWG